MPTKTFLWHDGISQWWNWQTRKTKALIPKGVQVRFLLGKLKLPYGVIGNTTDFGSVIIGSSPIGVTKRDGVY